MEWIILAIIAPILWAFNNIIDKIFIGKYVKDPTSYQILVLTSNIIPLIIFYLLLAPIAITKLSLLTIFLFVIYGLSFLFYNKALKIEEASRVTSILTINPVFTLPLAFIFLGEKLKLINYIGIFLMIIAAILVNYKKTKTKESFLSKAICLTLLTTFICSVTQIFSKNIINFMNPWEFVFWLIVGNTIAGFLLLIPKKNRKGFSKEVKINGIKPLIFWRLVALIFYYTGAIAFYNSISLGVVSIIAAVGSVQPFFVLLYAIILTKLKPELLKEEIDKTTLSFKFLSVVLIIIGAYLTIL